MSWITTILQLYSQVADLFGNVIVKRINIRLFDLLARFHYILNVPRILRPYVIGFPTFCVIFFVLFFLLISFIVNKIFEKKVKIKQFIYPYCFGYVARNTHISFFGLCTV